MSQHGNFNRLRRDSSGSVALIWALLSVPVFGMIGLSVDYAAMMSRARSMQQTLDAATLATSKELQTTGSTAAAEIVFNSFFQTEAATRLGIQPTLVSADAATNKVVTQATLDSTSYFAGVLGFKSTKVVMASSAEAGPLTSIEIAAMLDLSSSMTGSKFAELKDATKLFVNILKPDGAPEGKVHVAFAPFAAGVNAGKFAEDIANPAAPKSGNKCAPVRNGAEATTDTPPGPGAYFDTFVEDPATGYFCLRSEVLPLEGKKETINTAIDELELSGGTEGEIGTAWAWFLLSPKWASIWPASSTPKAYGTRGNMKVAILLTDGENYTRYFPNHEDADVRMLAVCNAMKASGITIFTIGVDIATDRAVSLLSGCASDANKYLVAQGDGGQIKAFRDIALLLAPLRLLN
jgi:Flp pilus assembly protein TadG